VLDSARKLQQGTTHTTRRYTTLWKTIAKIAKIWRI